MERTEITLAVKNLIGQAAREQGWSLAELTRRVGRGPSTLHRWRAGNTVCFDMQILLQLCAYAGTTLDQVFTLAPAIDLKPGARNGQVNAVGGSATGAVELRIIKELVRMTSKMISSTEDTIDGFLNRQAVPSRDSAITMAKDKLSDLVKAGQFEDETMDDVGVQRPA